MVRGGADSRIETLDVLRGVAVLAVFCFHYLGAVFGTDQLAFAGDWLDFRHPPRPEFLYFWPYSLGWVGVPLFFVISGFCIHISYLKQSRFSTGCFYGKRLRRLYPAYLVVFLLGWLAAVQRHEPEIWRQLAAHLIFAQNLFPNEIVFGVNGALWSLATEMQFYLIFPLILIWRRRIGLTAILAISFGVMISWRLGMLYLQPVIPQFSAAMATSAVPLIFDWLLGVSVAEAWWMGERAWVARSVWHLPAFLVALGLSVIWRPASMFSFPLASLFFAGVLGRLDLARRLSSRFARGLQYVGIGSYSLYLVHQPVSAWLLSHSPIRSVVWDMTAGFLLVGGLTWGVSQALYYSVEKTGVPARVRVAIFRN
jgi:peptidoglycan/LPS O-acetylase OafA/YrhL